MLENSNRLLMRWLTEYAVCINLLENDLFCFPVSQTTEHLNSLNTTTVYAIYSNMVNTAFNVFTAPGLHTSPSLLSVHLLLQFCVLCGPLPRDWWVRTALTPPSQEKKTSSTPGFPVWSPIGAAT